MDNRILDLIHNLTDLQVHFYSEGHRELADLHTPRRGVGDFRDGKGNRFLSASFEGGTVLVGPFLRDDDPLSPAVGSVLQGMEVPIRSVEKILAAMTLLKMLTERERLPSGIEIKEIATGNPLFEETYRPDIEAVNRRYLLEREMRRCIASGDRESLESLTGTADSDFNFLSRLPNNPMRAYKNMAIVANSVGRLSAEKGGLPPFILHSLSESIALEIEKVGSLEEILRYMWQIPLRYCEAVRLYGIENHSSLIVRTSQYILEHLYEKISLKELAGFTKANPSYLSRRFKEETGMTISAYIRSKRIIEAKWMLDQNRESITNIALSLGYEDVNYFSRVFRFETGMSPRDYRLQSRKEEFSGIPD